MQSVIPNEDMSTPKSHLWSLREFFRTGEGKVEFLAIINGHLRNIWYTEESGGRDLYVEFSVECALRSESPVGVLE